MPGGRGLRWKTKPPLYWSILAWVGVSNFFAFWILLFTISWWGQTTPDILHRVELHTRDDHTYYLGPVLGWVATYGFWIAVVLFGLCWLIMWFSWDKLEQGEKDHLTFLKLS